MDTKALYSLYVVEGIILTSVIYARHLQGKSTNQAKEEIAESERISNAQLNDIKKSVLEMEPDVEVEAPHQASPERLSAGGLGGGMGQPDTARSQEEINYEKALKQHGILLDDVDQEKSSSSTDS